MYYCNTGIPTVDMNVITQRSVLDSPGEKKEGEVGDAFRYGTYVSGRLALRAVFVFRFRLEHFSIFKQVR